jgi:RimJ/RimL family protein N-acetyltransferase
MIIPIEERYLDDVAKSQLLAWQKGFKGILSEQLLKSLDKNEFLRSWQQIILNKERVNYIALTKEVNAIGFVSFGPYDKVKGSEFAEIYGIYINPNYWRQGHAKSLMEKAVLVLEDSNKYSAIFIWTMVQNTGARKFYENFGFEPDGSFRTSERNGELFEECRYAYGLQS